MPRVFAITTPAATITLEPSGRGEVSFTVSNVTDGLLRAKASLVPSSALPGEWLSLRGSVLRDMPPGSTEVFTVEIQVPAGTAPGPRTFSLVVADNDVPDERFAEGPAVSVSVSAPVAAPARGSPWWLVAVGVGVVVAGGVAAFLALRDGEPPPAGCPVGQSSCAGECVDLQVDGQNCGRCGGTCGPDQRCQAGICQCTQGLALCGGACVSLESSDENCGRCGNACGAEFDCRAGQCVRTSCPGGGTLCGGQCVDTETDSRNCGRCGEACGPDRVCRNGRCQCPGTLTVCGSQCVDTRADEQNCGSCGRRCGAGQLCQAGTCQCPQGLTLCGGACVNLQTSDANCGRCGTSCGAGFDCRNGRCLRTSPSSECGLGQVMCPCTGTCLPAALCKKRCDEGRQPL
ncbi:MXAN_6577-like cysteine-rich protein [Hyalangium gracile]|uniref:MXAN_6577-like cysteine-rich protein n=1 Tax=Hyalangium gracile TaxID=394092 RepID=UPI001CCED5A9|nr:MXAN_6577-like cysteine-rich protein [Hyalangium gracile]